MNIETVKQWFIKADNDLKTAKDELNTDAPATDTVCFHAQQCVEKYLKGFLAFHDQEIKKTHNLTVILMDCIHVNTSFAELSAKQVDILTPHATVLRYPDDFYLPPVEEAQHAVQLSEDVKQFVLDTLHKQGFTVDEKQPQNKDDESSIDSFDDQTQTASGPAA